MPRRYHFIQADVFSGSAFGGNQLAVFTDARGLSTDEMQTLAREMNFSETTFVLPPSEAGGTTRVRIFTPGKELPMAGHPTVGTAFVLARRGDIRLDGPRTEATLLLGIGPVRVMVEAVDNVPAFVWMTHRKPEFGDIVTKRSRAAKALGLAVADLRDDRPVQVVTTGLPWLFVPLGSGAAARCQPNAMLLQALCEETNSAGIYAFSTDVLSPVAAFHARSFPTGELGIAEDAATGSAAAPFGAYVARYKLLPRGAQMRFVVEQGVEMRRPSEIHIALHTDGEEISNLSIGGRTVIVGEGTLYWD